MIWQEDIEVGRIYVYTSPWRTLRVVFAVVNILASTRRSVDTTILVLDVVVDSSVGFKALPGQLTDWCFTSLAPLRHAVQRVT